MLLEKICMLLLEREILCQFMEYLIKLMHMENYQITMPRNAHFSIEGMVLSQDEVELINEDLKR